MPRRWIVLFVLAALLGAACGAGLAGLTVMAAPATDRPLESSEPQPRRPRPTVTPTPAPTPERLAPAPAADRLDLALSERRERIERERERRRALAAQRRRERRERERRQRARERREQAATAAVQRRLTQLRYYAGAIDGEQGPMTTSAVMAFQKVNGVAVDGIVGPVTQAALDDPVVPTLHGGAPTRIEVDLTRQVLYYVSEGRLQRIVPVSSGSGQSYTTSSGGMARSLTPVGTFAVQRTISGVRKAPLGILYDPMYFYGGWAIHGSDSVPAYPASHGCVRVPRWDALWLFPRAPVGTQVVVYGGTHVFAPGSSAPGTDVPAGDTAADG